MSSETVILDLPYPLENLLEHTQFSNKTVVDITNKSLRLVVQEGVWYFTLNSFSLSLVPL